MMNKILFTGFLSFISSMLCAHGGGQYVHSDFFKQLETGDKAAILLVHFGTTHADTRALTIEALDAKAKECFPGVEVRRAYSSRIVIKRLGDRGEAVQNPLQALKQLHTDGYTHILIQASTVIDGVEMESLIRNVDEMRHVFKDVRVGTSLLYAPDDYAKVIAALTDDYRSDKAYVWVGHGTYDSSTAQYAMLDYMLKAKGHANCMVGTIEGYPEYDDMLAQLKASGLKEVVLVPLMFVAGEHAKNDIAGDWKEALEQEGFVVETDMRGLGERSRIQDIYMEHLKFIVHHRKLDIMEKKAVYEETGEKMGEH